MNGSAVAGIVDHLREQILTGSLPAGTVLPPERELAARLGISRATLRQGLSVLGQMGLVATVRGRNGGAVVTAPSPANVASSVTLLLRTRAVTVAQLTETRRALEVEAAQLAALRRSAADLAAIEAAFAAYVESEGDPDRHNRLGRRFHYAVARAGANPLLTEMMYSLNEAFAECLALMAVVPVAPGTAARIHRPIVAAIRRRDADAARRAMVDHFAQLERLQHDLDLGGRLLGQRRDRAAPATGDAAAKGELVGAAAATPERG